MGEIPIPSLIKAVTKALIFTMQQQPPHMGRIPIPTLIKADMEAAGPYAQKHSFSRWSSNLPHNIRNYIMQGTSWMLPSTRDAQAARLPNHPAIPAIYHTVGVFVLCRGQSRAEPNSVQCRHNCKYFRWHRLLNRKVDESIMIEAERHHTSYFDLMVCVIIVYHNAIYTDRAGECREEREVT